MQFSVHTIISFSQFYLKKNLNLKIILFAEMKKISGSTFLVPAILHDVMGECRVEL